MLPRIFSWRKDEASAMLPRRQSLIVQVRKVIHIAEHHRVTLALEEGQWVELGRASLPYRACILSTNVVRPV